MVITYRNTYGHGKDVKDYFSKRLSSIEYSIFLMLYDAYQIKHMINSPYFSIIRCGDGKYELMAQKNINEEYCIKFIINYNHKSATNKYGYEQTK